MTEGLKIFLIGVICGGIGSTLFLFLICSLMVGGDSDDYN